MLYLIQSNRLERLFDRLCLTLGDSPTDPLKPVEIVVQNPGMGRWVSQQMAQKVGIAANFHFPLPARFLWRMLASQLELDSETRVFDRSVLQWRILDELSDSAQFRSFPEIQQYLKNDYDGRKIFQLASKAADLFDQYLVYRPDVLLGWESSKGSGWQAQLWQNMTAMANQHRAKYIEQFLKLSRMGKLSCTELPQQIFFFGISSMPPVYLQVIHAISKDVDVYLFHMNPCREYWADITSEAEQARKRKYFDRIGTGAEYDYFFRGNPLLASLGKVGREFMNHIQNLDVVEHQDYLEPKGGSMLASLQKDVLDLVDHSDPSTEKVGIGEKDRSVQLHSCHSRMREVQVLHDRLLELFEQEKDLKPSDILVMAPVIEEYDYAIRSVFDGVHGKMFIPWSIADRSIHAENTLADSFLSLFELCRSRFTAPEVVSFLETGAVMRRFHIDEEGLSKIRRWVDDSGIRWGLDAEHRREFSSGMDGINSWSFGMDRLFMSYFTGDLAEVTHSICPVAGPISGNDADLLGGFATFMASLRNTRENFLKDSNPSDWTVILLELLDRFFDPGSSEEEEQSLMGIRAAICSFGDDAQQAEFDRLLNVVVVRDYLKDALSEPSSGQAFLSGRITFCNMVPMRSIPFRVICLLGMNDSEYPRNQNVAGFDLIASNPRSGDRNRRDDDRYLFLEALLSARNVFYVSWCGRNHLDNSIRPPSVVVSELLDYMSRSLITGSGKSLDKLVIEHPLQPFSRKCFDGTTSTSSFAQQWIPAGVGKGENIFVAHSLPEPPEEWRTVDIKQLVQFWSHPVRYFLRYRLNMHLYETDDLLDENEVFQPHPLDRYTLIDRLVKAKLGGNEADIQFSLLQAEGALPHGSFGENYYKDLIKNVEGIMPAIVSYLGKPADPLEVDIPIDGFRIKGWLTGLYDSGCVRIRPAKIKGKDLVKLWVEHLVYNTVKKGSMTCRSIHVASDVIAEYGAVADPGARLRTLLELYWQGLKTPLHFFPETSRAWMNNGKQRRSQSKVSTEWFGGFNKRGEGEELEYKIAQAGLDNPLNEKFEQLAEAVYGPLFEDLELSNA